MAVGVAKALLSFQTVSTFSSSEGGKKHRRHFSNPPPATVPDAAMSNGLIGLLCKYVGIKKKEREQLGG